MAENNSEPYSWGHPGRIPAAAAASAASRATAAGRLDDYHYCAK
ncbi:MAG: hypothetical protein SPJ78_07960 [Corynebacterium camporealensis]|nr:hypothetical protein [Corynebacterium camporealensis]MDY5840631.1 hypothetical protein [Corynebacterium camporealensis]